MLKEITEILENVTMMGTHDFNTLKELMCKIKRYLVYFHKIHQD